jgi:hypothetical protein
MDSSSKLSFFPFPKQTSPPYNSSIQPEIRFYYLDESADIYEYAYPHKIAGMDFGRKPKPMEGGVVVG